MAYTYTIVVYGIDIRCIFQAKLKIAPEYFKDLKYLPLWCLPTCSSLRAIGQLVTSFLSCLHFSLPPHTTNNSQLTKP